MSYCPNYRRKEIPRKANNPEDPLSELLPRVFHECACIKQVNLTGGSDCNFFNREHECPQNPQCME